MEQRRVEQREHRRNSNNFLAWLSSKNCVPVVLHVSVLYVMFITCLNPTQAPKDNHNHRSNHEITICTALISYKQPLLLFECIIRDFLHQ